MQQASTHVLQQLAASSSLHVFLCPHNRGIREQLDVVPEVAGGSLFVFDTHPWVEVAVKSEELVCGQ